VGYSHNNKEDRDMEAVAVKTTMFDKLRWKLQGVKWWLRRNIRNRLIRLLGGVPSGGKDSNYLSHAIREFDVAFPNWREDDMQKMMCDGVLDILRVFGDQGHSGFSASYAIGMIKPLLNFDPITPLTGEDDEYKRMGSVFKDEDGKPYWSNGRVFREPDGCCYTGRGSRVEIEFPWTKPDKPEYVDVDKEGNPIN
jgi:hypothetical protein